MNLYFKVLPDNPVFEALKALFQKRLDCEDIRRDFIKKHGLSEEIAVSKDQQMIGVKFEQVNPEGWKRIDKSPQFANYYEPKASNKKLRHEFWEIPYVKRDEWNKVIEFEPDYTITDRGFIHHSGFAIKPRETMYVLEVPSACKFNREYLIEITGTEFLELTSEPAVQ